MKYYIIQREISTGEELRYPKALSIERAKAQIETFKAIDEDAGILGKYHYSLHVEKSPTPPKQESFFQKYGSSIAAILSGVAFGIFVNILILGMIK